MLAATILQRQLNEKRKNNSQFSTLNLNCMWRKLLRAVGFVLAVALVVAYICYASHLAQQRNATQRVERVVISIPDSSELCRFASVAQIRKHLQDGKFELENVVADSIDAVNISKHIMECGFVRDVDVYTTYSGDLHIDIRQHQPLLRLLCNGYNTYVTQGGDLFRSPCGGAYYAAVVTGGYKPQFSADYEGGLDAHFKEAMRREDEKYAKICKAIADIEQEHRSCKSSIADLKDSKRKTISEYLFKRKEMHDMRVAGIEIEIEKQKKRQAELASRIASLKEEKYNEACHKKKIEKRYDDFANLINFVSQIERDSFWGSEIVQYVADTTSLGEISLRLVPRSGDFVIEFGTLTEREDKLAKLQRFYDNGLSQFGWDRYKIVDLRYKKQIICR